MNKGKVIAVSSSKGGVGKSNTATNLAVDLANKKNRVLLVDAEESGTTLDWQERDHETLTIINGYDKSFPNMIDVYRKSFDYIIIDTAGVNADMNRDYSENFQSKLNQKILCKSDFILIPVPPSPVDIRKTMRFFAAVENYVEASMGQRKAMMFINKAKTNTKHTNEAKNILRDFENIPLAQVAVRLYTDFETAEGEYMSVNEYAPDSNAALDMRRLQKEILNYLNEE